MKIIFFILISLTLSGQSAKGVQPSTSKTKTPRQIKSEVTQSIWYDLQYVIYKEIDTAVVNDTGFVILANENGVGSWVKKAFIIKAGRYIEIGPVYIRYVICRNCKEN